jgi:hypothetical protein
MSTKLKVGARIRLVNTTGRLWTRNPRHPKPEAVGTIIATREEFGEGMLVKFEGYQAVFHCEPSNVEAL